MAETCKYEQIVDVQAKYENITLSFGKYKGMTLKEVINDGKGDDYLKWLYIEMQKKETTSPTQKAIMKYIKSVYEL
jgi:hypothetical protein